MSSELKIKASNAAEKLPGLFKTWREPAFFIQCGSGFSYEGLFDEAPESVSLAVVPDMPETCTPDGNDPRLLLGSIGGISVLALEGHRHVYEGLGVLPCILPLCVAYLLGARNMLFIDSGLSLNMDLKPGKWLMLTDFINGHGISPLAGNQDMLECAFPDMTNALSQHLNSELMNSLAGVGISPMLGIYTSHPGSGFCTVAEAGYARNAGADMIGHDLTVEICMAHAMGCKVSALALAALPAPDYYSKPVRRQDMLDACAFCSYGLMRGLRNGIREFMKSTY